MDMAAAASGLASIGVALFQTKQQAVANADGKKGLDDGELFHREALERTDALHLEAILQARRQHVEASEQNIKGVTVSAALAQEIAWTDARREYKLHWHGVLMGLHSGRAEARRDAWEQSNTNFQTIIMGATFMLGGAFVVLIEGDNTAEHYVGWLLTNCGSLCISADVLFDVLTLLLNMGIVLLGSAFFFAYILLDRYKRYMTTSIDVVQSHMHGVAALALGKLRMLEDATETAKHVTRADQAQWEQRHLLGTQVRHDVVSVDPTPPSTHTRLHLQSFSFRSLPPLQRAPFSACASGACSLALSISTSLHVEPGRVGKAPLGAAAGGRPVLPKEAAAAAPAALAPLRLLSGRDERARPNVPEDAAVLLLRMGLPRGRRSCV
jgi:hypothetical protein